jgi:hypothetical protein
VATPDPTTITMLGGACAAMSTVIGVLWKQTQRHLTMIEGKLRHTEDRLADCEDDRLKIWQQLAHLSIHDRDDKDAANIKRKK